MRKTFKKGFTLLELIVVMAIFSLLMVAVMSMIDPVSQIFKRQSVAEKTYSYAHNIQTYLQTQLEYAESMVVTTGDMFKEDSTDTKFETHPGKDIEEAVKVYAQKHFEYDVIPKDKNDIRWMKGKVHVLRMVNTGADRGQIKHSIYEFKSNTEDNKGITVTLVQSETDGINPAFFKANDAKYNFSYALGASTLVSVPTPAGGDANSTYKALNADKIGGKAPDVRMDSFNISIVIDKAGKNNQGSIDVSVNKDDEGNPLKDAEGNPTTNNYRAFRMPAVLQVASIELSNVLLSNPTGYAYQRTFKKNGTEDIAYTPDNSEAYRGLAYEPFLPDDVNFDNDIYFIYALTDEMEPGDEINEVV